MGRPPRVQLAGACYYIVLQGNNRQDIFLSNQDRRYFLSLLRAYKGRWSLKVYAYSLMPSSAELLLETAQPNLSMVMQGFNTTYTKHFNSQRGSVGHVFGGRYKALIVDKERHLGEMTRYVHLACVRSGLKEKPWRYQWSSCSAYVESSLKEPLIDSDSVLRQFGKIRFKSSVRYLRYIKDGMRTASESVLPSAGGVIGGEAFRARVESSAGVAPPKQTPPAEAARRIISETASKHGVDEDRLLGRLQWRELSSLRRKTIHRIWKETRMGVSELARLFNRTPSAVSQLIREFEGSRSS